MKTARQLVALLFVLALVAAACGGTDEGTDSTTTTAGADETTTTAMAEETTTTAMSEETTTTAMEEHMGGTIIIGTTDEVASLDSADAYSTADWELIKAFNEPLLRFQPGSDSVLEPGIADLPEVSDDGLTYTLTLHDGLVFGDGTPLTVDMAVEQLNRLMNADLQATAPNQVGNTLAIPYVSSIEAQGDNQIVFTLAGPASFFPQILAGAPYTIANPNIFPVDEINLLPEGEITGLGPWKITSNLPGEQTVLEPNEYYTGKYPAKADQIIIRRFSTPSAMADAVRSGEIDISWRILGSEAANELKSVDGLTVATVPQAPIRYLIVNHADGFVTSDPLVRKALAAAVDRDELSDVVFGGAVTPLLSPVPPGFLGANESFEDAYQAPNVSMAQDLLTQAGYSEDNKLQIELGFPPEHYGVTTADGVLLIAQQWEATGMIDVNEVSQEWSTYVSDCTNGDTFDVCVLGWFFDFPDAENYLQPFIEGDGLGSMVLCPNDSCGDATTTGTDPALGDLLLQQRAETDMGARADILGQLQDVYADEVVTIPLWLEPEFIIYRDGIAADSSLPNPESLNIGPDFEFIYSLLTTN
jgi:peptide/nickel transport system substrate-binding protein